MAVSGMSVGSGTSWTNRAWAPSQIRARKRASGLPVRPTKASLRREREWSRNDPRGEHRALRSGDRTLVTKQRDLRVAEDHRSPEDHHLAVRQIVDAELIAHP